MSPYPRSEPDRATWSFPHQINLTFGRRSRRLHQDPACGGWGSRGRNHSHPKSERSQMSPRFPLSLLRPLTPPSVPKPQPPTSAATAAFIIRAGKLRRGERLDDDQDEKPEPQPGDLIRDAIRKQQEGK